MTMARRIDPELDIDFSERSGFLTGKAAALADWQHRKDAKAFAKLVAVLATRRWRIRNPKKARDLYRRADLRRRARRHAAKVALTKGHVLTCAWCGTQWCRIPRPKMGPTPLYCCADHGTAARYERHAADPAWRAKNNERVIDWQRAHPEKTRAKARRYVQKRRKGDQAA